VAITSRGRNCYNARVSENLMEQARRALRETRTEDAQAILINVIVRQPEDDEAWLLLAEALSDETKKRECLERARSINPRNPAILRALETLGAVTTRGGEVDRAADADDRALPPLSNAPPHTDGIPLLDYADTIAMTVMLTTDAQDTRNVGLELVRVLSQAAERDFVRTRRWARAAGRDALFKYEKALTHAIVNLAHDDPQLPHLRQERQRALDFMK
jgi:tetratricopeptide (TPR) repeat protein